MIRKIQTGYSAVAGFVVTIFVVLIGALGYTYLINYNAQVARTNEKNNSSTIAAESAVVPEVESSSDLAELESMLEAVSVDDLSSTDLDTLDSESSNF